MAVNKNYCKPSDDGKQLVFAPVVIPPSPHAPTEAEYNMAGWYRYAVEPPHPPEGKVVSGVTYKIVDNATVAEYSYEDAPPRVRTFSKFSLWLVLTEMGLWDAFEEWLKNQTIEGRNAYVAFTIANDLTDANPMFHGLVNDAKDALGVTDEQLEQILAAAEIA